MSRMVLSRPTWVDSSAGPLAAWLHARSPDNVRSGVVVCSPIGREGIIAHTTIRYLCDELARRGFAALRFDLPGTGDSAGGPESVERWLDGIQAAVEFVRRAGCRSVILAGMRMGATLAATAASRCGPLESIVLWDPCLSGRAFLREQQALQMLEIGSVDQHDDGSQEALGFVYPRGLVSDLGSLKVDPQSLESAVIDGHPEGSCLLVHRPEQSNSRVIKRLLTSSRWQARLADQQGALLERRSFDADIPQGTVNDIVAYLDDRAGKEKSPVEFPIRQCAEVGSLPDGRTLFERFETFGPAGMVGVVSETAGMSSYAPALICTNVAAEYHIGPGRGWVDLARKLAELGVRSVRFDRTGVGESNFGVDLDRSVMYGSDAVDDLVAVATTVRDNGASSVDAVGSCSGAWEVAMAAATGALTRSWLINVAKWDPIPRPVTGSDAAVQVETYSAVGAGKAPWPRRLKRWVKAAMPYWVWLRICRRGLGQTPEVLLAGPAKRGMSVSVLLSPDDRSRFESQRGTEGVRRLRRKGGPLIEIRDLQRADHALFSVAGRGDALQILIDHYANNVASPYLARAVKERTPARPRKDPCSR